MSTDEAEAIQAYYARTDAARNREAVLRRVTKKMHHREMFER
jgi:hypothetical protein